MIALNPLNWNATIDPPPAEWTKAVRFEYLVGDLRVLIGSIPDDAMLLDLLIKRIEREYR